MIQKSNWKKHGSVLKPVEGTMLTVIRETTEELEKSSIIQQHLKYFWTCWKFARKACDNTPNKLKNFAWSRSYWLMVEKNLYSIILGMNSNLKGRADWKIKEEAVADTFIQTSEVYDGEFGYCTEFIIELAK